MGQLKAQTAAENKPMPVIAMAISMAPFIHGSVIAAKAPAETADITTLRSQPVGPNKLLHDAA